MNLVRTQSFHIDVKSIKNKTLLISVFNRRTITIMNRILGRYNGIAAQEGEEAMYGVTEAEYRRIQHTLTDPSRVFSGVESYWLNPLQFEYTLAEEAT